MLNNSQYAAVVRKRSGHPVVRQTLVWKHKRRRVGLDCVQRDSLQRGIDGNAKTDALMFDKTEVVIKADNTVLAVSEALVEVEKTLSGDEFVK
jgi:hypothetical protein